jgi:hypothetical protein
MTVTTRVIQIFLARQENDFVPLSNDLRLQVLPSVEYLPRCQRHHFGAFIQDQQILLVWDDQARHLLDRAEYFEKSLMEMIWVEGEELIDEKKDAVEVGSEEVDPNKDLESAEPPRRKTMLINPIMVGLTLALLFSALGLGWRNLGLEVAADGKYSRLALLVVTPCQIFVSLFFMQIIVVNLCQMMGPTRQMAMNTKFYSGKPPPQINRNTLVLPHVTIQMPVYKEGLVGVIMPTVHSLKAAISTYELQGGSANIFVNDDGMQLLPDNEARARREFYEEHSIGWVARPKHNPNPAEGETPFLRRGKFKKASNMNYALMISNKVEDRLAEIHRPEGWSQEDEDRVYDTALADVLEAEEGRAWAEGNIRVGDYILLIDSDTRIPSDCLLDAVSEMEQSPEVGILQYSSGVMQVTSSFFECGYVISPSRYHFFHFKSSFPFLLAQLTLFKASPSSPTSSTPPSNTPSPTATSPPLLATTPSSAGPPSKKCPTQTMTATKNSGPNPTSPKTSTCLSVSRSPNTQSVSAPTPAWASKKVSPSLCTTSLPAGKNTPTAATSCFSIPSDCGSRVVHSLRCLRSLSSPRFV